MLKVRFFYVLGQVILSGFLFAQNTGNRIFLLGRKSTFGNQDDLLFTSGELPFGRFVIHIGKRIIVLILLRYTHIKKYLKNIISTE